MLRFLGKRDWGKVAWDQAPLWGKGKKRATGKKIGELSGPSGGLGRGKGQRSLETCLWFRRFMIPDSGIMLWLVKWLHVDRFVVLLTVSRSFTFTLLLFAKRFRARKQISLRDFSLLPRHQEEQKCACDSLQKEKLSIQNIEPFL